MELVDIYDAQGRPTGKVQDREAPLAAGEYLLAVGVWIVDGEGCILLTQRSPEKRWAPGKGEHRRPRPGRGGLPRRHGPGNRGDRPGDCPGAAGPLGSSPATGHYIGGELRPALAPAAGAPHLPAGGDLRSRGSPPRSWSGWPKAGSFPLGALHLEGSYREAFLQFIGRQGSTLLRKG
ncbi:MAG: hypothetical protein ACLRSY_00830 [Acutalibacter sp.]